MPEAWDDTAENRLQSSLSDPSDENEMDDGDEETLSREVGDLKEFATTDDDFEDFNEEDFDDDFDDDFEEAIEDEEFDAEEDEAELLDDDLDEDDLDGDFDDDDEAAEADEEENEV